MNKLSKKIFAVLLSAAMLITTFVISPVSALAVSGPVDVESSKVAVWADPENVLTQAKVDAFAGGDTLAAIGSVQPFKRSSSSGSSIIGGGSSSDGNFYWFFPSNTDLNALKIWFAAGSTLSINGTPITSGTPTNVFSEINDGGVSKVYTVTLNSTSYTVTAIKSGDVGTVYIDTQSGSLKTITESEDHSAWESGMIMVIQPDGSVDYSGILSKMSGRGNGTWDASGKKNPYNIKLAVSTSLLGMGSAKKWCLLANDVDKSLVKNQLTYDFADYIGMNYQPHCKPVDLYVNQQYLGSYQLAEKVEIKSNRINISDAYENLEIANGTTDATTGAIIPKDLTGTATSLSGAEKTTAQMNSIELMRTPNVGDHTIGAKICSPTLTSPSDYTGGYLYELEISNRWVTENAGFCAYNRQGWVLKSCDYASSDMLNYSYDLLFALGSSVYNGGTVPSASTTTKCSSLTSTTTKGANSVTNPAPATQYQGKKWSDLLDADSAVKYYWMQEFFKNMDTSTSSTYFYKDSDSIDTKLYAGPVWDMDNTLGKTDGSSGSRWGYSYTTSDGWYAKNARIYRWRSQDSTMDYDSDKKSPLNFYGALATNCTDFWTMAERYYFRYISPAVDILLGKAEDSTGKLHSISYYVNTVNKSAQMDAIRQNVTYDASNYISMLSTWVSERQVWISDNIPKTDLSTATLGTINQQTYTGYEITPSLSVSLFKSGTGNVVLEQDVDYALSYENNINAGTATVIVTGKGTYTGTTSKTFNIVAANLAVNHTLTIDSAAYKDMELTAALTNSSAVEITSGVSYQWYKDGVAIDGAQQSTYTTVESDAGSIITCVATGDGTNLINSVTSNECEVLAGTRPEGYTKTIASWDYDYSADSTLLQTGDPTGATFYYGATGGENQASANLYASVNATDNAKIKWSGSADLYTNDGQTLASDQAPVMGTSKTALLAWGEYPYFEAVVSTAGFENIKFSAKLGGSKKGPRDWKLQYSLDGATYTDVEGATYSITANKAMELAFNNVQLPQECENQKQVYIRMIVTANVAINGINTILHQTSGDAAINNIAVTGASLSVVTSLYEPTITTADGATVFNDNGIEILDNNGGADVYYSVNGGEPVLYTGQVYPFNAKTAKAGESATIVAYSQFNDIKSSETSITVTFGGTDINSFIYTDFSQSVNNGQVQSTGGTYGESGRMTACADSTTQYVPLWRADNGSFCVAPDDGLKWTEDSGFTYKVCTVGFENISFSCMAYTTLSGPNSATLQYSLNGVDYTDVQSNVKLPANGVLEQYMVMAKLPNECNNQSSLYIRLATTENLTSGSTTLHNNESKGNLYVNNVVVAGDDTGAYKMPYTNKSTAYFGEIGTIKYISPDGLQMQYIVKDSKDNVVQVGTYAETGIQLSTVKGFDKTASEAYTIVIEAIEDEDKSVGNIATYYYKGETVVKFNYNSTTKLFTNYVSADNLSVAGSSGTKSGTLSMYPNGTDATLLSYTGTYGVKVSWLNTNPFTATKSLDNPTGNGYWLIKTSTLGYDNLTLNVEQLSSNKGPRDWGVAYSTDGSSYTYISNSNARAISNDSTTKAVETYGNLALPSACDNQETLYIKIFINGGESVDGTELNLVTKGNTGIDGVEICGTPLAKTVGFNVVLPEGKNSTVPATAVSNAEIYVDGVLMGETDSNGSASVRLAIGRDSSIEVKFGNASRTVVVSTTESTADQTVALQVLDANNDGYVNAKDFAVVNKNSKYDSYKSYFNSYINQTTVEAYN